MFVDNVKKSYKKSPRPNDIDVWADNKEFILNAIINLAEKGYTYVIFVNSNYTFYSDEPFKIVLDAIDESPFDALIIQEELIKEGFSCKLLSEDDFSCLLVGGWSDESSLDC